MADLVLLHIGAMKSGTSFLQNVLGNNERKLERQGFRFAGERWTDQIKAVMELIERGGLKQRPLASDGPWKRLVADVNAHSGTAIISVEFLGPRMEPKIKQLMKSFPDNTRFEVILTARDLARVIPAMWQESVQNGGVTTWREFLDVVRDTPRKEGPGRWFWRQQDIASIAERWSKAVGRDRFSLITVPPPGADRSLLWTRFAATAGIDPTGFNLKVRRNPSLGLASTLVLRDLNEMLDNELERTLYHGVVKHSLAKRGMVHHGEEPTLGLDESWVLERSAKEIARLRALDLRVVGDLSELDAHPVPGIQPSDVDAAAQLDAAMHALGVAVRKWSNTRSKVRKK